MKYLLMLLSVLTLVTVSQAAIIFEQNWEDGNEPTSSSAGFYINNQACYSYSIDNVTTRARNGTHSLRSFWLDGDTYCDSRPRAQIQIVTKDAVINGTRVLPIETDRWYGFSIYVESSLNIDREHIWNPHAHNWPDDCVISISSPFALYIVGDKWSGTQTIDNNQGNPADYAWRLTGHPPGYNGAEPGLITLMLISADEDVDGWTDFVFHFNLDYDVSGTGFVTIWKNGVKVYDNQTFDLNEYDVDSTVCGDFFPKTGISTVSGVYHDMVYWLDSMRWGDEDSNYGEIAPRKRGIPLMGN